jgi:hypothetical protein
MKASSKNSISTWDTHHDTWAATDGLGRKLPSYEEVGPPRTGKYVGIFYFLWLGEHGTDGPYDVSKILAADPAAIHNPNSPPWGPMYAPHHWGEPLFGYYLSDDEWVLRKHAQMLADAGVDTLIFDVTNGFTYPENYRTLCRVFTEIRNEGGRTPQIAFLTPFGDPSQVVSALFKDLYQPGDFPDLWFRWEGNPLILADPAQIGRTDFHTAQDGPARLEAGHTQGQTFTADRPFFAVGGRFPTWESKTASVTLILRQGGPDGKRLQTRRLGNVQDNAWGFLTLDSALPPGTYTLEQSEPEGTVGWWSSSAAADPTGNAEVDGKPVPGNRTLSIRYENGSNREILNFFTFRKPDPDYFRGPGGPNEWGWLEVYPQHAFYKTPGVPEEVTVGVAQNAVEGKLGVLSNPRSHGRSFHDGTEPPPSGQDLTGRNFAEQAKRALELDPAFVFITGWNEWIAGRFPQDAPFYGAGPVSFVDEFNEEFSRDIEPMKGGHTDHYYYQLVDFIRRFKGVRKPEPAGPPRTIQIGGDFKQWQSVHPEYKDDLGDMAHRSHRGWGREGRYRNETGRNDFTLLKVARDNDHLYFYACTRDPITPPESSGWMMLFLNTDGNPKTGWEGYDYRVTGIEKNSNRRTLERYKGEGAWEAVAEIEFHMKGREMELALPRKALNLAGPLKLEFKWIDNPRFAGDLLSVYTEGDAAPNGRFNYVYEAG